MIIFSAFLEFWRDFFISVLKVEFVPYYFVVAVTLCGLMFIYNKIRFKVYGNVK